MIFLAHDMLLQIGHLIGKVPYCFTLRVNVGIEVLLEIFLSSSLVTYYRENQIYPIYIMS